MRVHGPVPRDADKSIEHPRASHLQDDRYTEYIKPLSRDHRRVPDFSNHTFYIEIAMRCRSIGGQIIMSKFLALT